MINTPAIPAYLDKPENELTPEERIELQEFLPKPMNEEEAAQFESFRAAWRDRDTATERAISVKHALERSDMVALRCLKAGVAFPQDWQEYCLALRRGELPTQPTYPANT